MEYKKNILITGGAGFIGSHAVRHFVKRYPQYRIVNLDKLTYAGNLENLRDIEQEQNYHFIRGDIVDATSVSDIFSRFDIDTVIHLAAESHVDRSITNPLSFVETNVVGTVVLLNLARQFWEGREEVVFYHVSTDEVFGSLQSEGYFDEKTPYNPQSPYSASKAGSDHFVRAYANTYGLPIVISNCSNNYGPYQFPEKLLPLMINNLKMGRALPVYGDGSNVRDWLYVEDHVQAIDMIMHRGMRGETYLIGGENEIDNLSLVRKLCDIADDCLGRKSGSSRELITFVRDRPGHDKRYAIDSQKLRKELGWSPEVSLDVGLRTTVRWYLDHPDWLEHVTSGEYQKYYEEYYSGR
jgi:dTDP-glucose 4,6-dehydratase